jgi:hypothetical protein
MVAGFAAKAKENKARKTLGLLSDNEDGTSMIGRNFGMNE